MVDSLAQPLLTDLIEAADQQAGAAPLPPIHPLQCQLPAGSVVDRHHGTPIQQCGGAHQLLHKVGLAPLAERQNLVPRCPVGEGTLVVPHQCLQGLQLFVLLAR